MSIETFPFTFQHCKLIVTPPHSNFKLANMPEEIGSGFVTKYNFDCKKFILFYS
jgi:hypothetical protein